jgi:hypothetical protein
MLTRQQIRKYCFLVGAFAISLALVGCPPPRYRYRVSSEKDSLKNQKRIELRLVEFKISAYYGYAGYNSVGGLESVFNLEVNNRSDDTLRISTEGIAIISKYYDYRIRYIGSKMKYGLFSDDPVEEYNVKDSTIKIAPHKDKSFYINSWRPKTDSEKLSTHFTHPNPDEKSTLVVEKITLGNEALEQIEASFQPR